MAAWEPGRICVVEPIDVKTHDLHDAKCFFRVFIDTTRSASVFHGPLVQRDVPLMAIILELKACTY
jgi:hypothetical protein